MLRELHERQTDSGGRGGRHGGRRTRTRRAGGLGFGQRERITFFARFERRILVADQMQRDGHYGRLLHRGVLRKLQVQVNRVQDTSLDRFQGDCVQRKRNGPLRENGVKRKVKTPVFGVTDWKSEDIVAKSGNFANLATLRPDTIFLLRKSKVDGQFATLGFEGTQGK